jgi:FkbM family methyltransferase
MINFSGISNYSVIGEILRFPLKFIPQNMIVLILQGRLKGKKWIVGSSNHGCWFGSYEHDKQKLFASTVKEGSVVYDIGAHVGFYTLLASELVGSGGNVIAFEPVPRNLRYLKEHLRLNHCDNVMVIEAAVADRSGNTFFEDDTSSYTGHLSSKGCLEIKTIALDDLVTKGEIPPPDYMKIDVEGAELLVLSGARQVLEKYHPTILLATHGVDIHQQYCTFLKSIGYFIKSVNEKSIDETDEILAFKKAKG